MKMKAMILEYTSRQAQFEGRSYEVRSLALLDRSEGCPRLRQTVDFTLTVEQSNKLPAHDKLADQMCEVGIVEIKSGSNGRYRLSGEILTLNGKPLGEAVQGK